MIKGVYMRIKERVNYNRIFKCHRCGLVFNESEITSEDKRGNDKCPACGCIDFKFLAREGV